MNDDLVIKYFGIKLRYPSYIKLQISCVIFLIILAIASLLFGGESSDYAIRNGWWICLLLILAEIAESMWAINKAKKEKATNT